MNLRTMIITLFLAYSVFLTGCGPNDLHRLHTTLNNAARLENSAAKSNHQFYEQAVYGPVGSAVAIRIRQKAATAIHASNEYLIKALELAKVLTKETFEQGKLAVLQTLAQAAAGLRVGNQVIDLVLQSIATVINQAIVIVQAFQAKDLNRVLPFIQSLKLAEVTA